MTELTDTYAIGMRWVVGGLFGAFLIISVIEVVFELKRWPSISYRFEDWALRNPWFSSALLVIVFMLLAHFVLNPLCPDDQPLCP